MGLFNRKPKAAQENTTDERVYAFYGLGMMARFMDEKQLNDLKDALPAMIGHACGTSRSNVVMVPGSDWLSEKYPGADSINFDGTPAFPGMAQMLCEEYLKSKGLYKHVVGDRQFLGVLANGDLEIGTLDDMQAKNITVNGASILVSAWLAFPASALQM